MTKRSILLVEDDELDVISVTRTLKKLDVEHELHTAFNGIEALAMLRGDGMPRIKQPDIILLDINMPRMNGIEFLKELRKDSTFSSIQVYVMTTSSEEYDITQSMDVAGYIIKPLNFNDNSKRTSSMDNFMQFHLLKILESIE
jgi:CheY-like chemotaxis protein